jgi:hypothetical protein
VISRAKVSTLHATSTAPAEEEPKVDTQAALTPKRAPLWHSIQRGKHAIRPRLAALKVRRAKHTVAVDSHFERTEIESTAGRNEDLYRFSFHRPSWRFAELSDLQPAKQPINRRNDRNASDGHGDETKLAQVELQMENDSVSSVGEKSRKFKRRNQP